jgi:hypothetical protein
MVAALNAKQVLVQMPMVLFVFLLVSVKLLLIRSTSQMVNVLNVTHVMSQIQISMTANRLLTLTNVSKAYCYPLLHQLQQHANLVTIRCQQANAILAHHLKFQITYNKHVSNQDNAILLQ